MRANFSNPKQILSLVFIFISLSACSTPATPVAAPTQAPIPTATSVPLYQQITVTTASFSDSGKSPDYTIQTQTPAIMNNSDPRSMTFTTEMHGFVQGLINDFKKKLAQNPATPIKAPSYLDVRYQLVSPPGNVLSIKYETEGYFAGMAHPYHLIYSFNYDLEKGKDIALIDLFLPNTDYLGAVSKYCIAQLSTRDIDFKDFAQGADPTADNYKNWNITADGLMITFDEYQVAAYVAGPQVVTVPYSELKTLVDPNGPVGSLVH